MGADNISASESGLSKTFNFLAAHAAMVVGVHLLFPGAGAALDGLFNSIVGNVGAVTPTGGLSGEVLPDLGAL